MLTDHAERFTHRCFTESERDYADVAQAVRAERYAARFAAKEAILKALGTGLRDGIDWTELTITRDSLGKPGVILAGRASVIATEAGIRSWHLSLTHAGGMAMASVIAAGDPS